MTKIDVLSGMDTLKVCVAYEIDGQRVDYVPSSVEDVAAAVPIYEELEGWQEDISKMTTWDELPSAAQKYIRFIETFTGVRVSMISVGPDRSNNIYVHDLIAAGK